MDSSALKVGVVAALTAPLQLHNFPKWGHEHHQGMSEGFVWKQRSKDSHFWQL